MLLLEHWLYLDLGNDIFESARMASAVATISVQGKGTQSSFPGLDQLPAELRVKK